MSESEGSVEPRSENLPEKKEEVSVPAEPMNLEDGLMVAKTSNDEWRIANMMIKSAALPQQFKNIPQVIMALQFLKAHKLPPMIAIRQTTIINGTLSIWGELPKALVKRSGLMKQMQESIYDNQYNEICLKNKNLNATIFGASCMIEGVDGTTVERSFTVEDAKKAGLWDKDIWKKYPKRMLQMRARGWALKDFAPEILSGIAIAEYDFDSVIEETDGEIRQVTGGSVADEMNKTLVDDEKNAPSEQVITQAVQ